MPRPCSSPRSPGAQLLGDFELGPAGAGDAGSGSLEGSAADGPASTGSPDGPQAGAADGSLDGGGADGSPDGGVGPNRSDAGRGDAAGGDAAGGGPPTDGAADATLDGPRGDATDSGPGGDGNDGGAPGDASPVDGSSGGLLLDCTRTANASDPRCTGPSCAFAGTLGAGPILGCSSGFPEIRFGFVDPAAGRLVVAVEMGVQSDANGGVFSVDLRSGDRTLLSGQYQDPATGTVARGTGPDLGGVWDVEAAPDGSWLALVAKGSTDNRQIVRVDPATGNRVLVDDFSTLDCGGGICVTPGYLGGLAVAGDGSVYLGLDDNPVGSGNGVARLAATSTPTAPACSVISLAPT
ncbi:MAG: hypothetical protein JOZ69_19745, partial [Myxococcales bacterium]|nr:hypothetical protein [Myxococcales bacterium]